ncbi:DUF1684 domain-containing protein [Quatrionicoccus australiensis]|uniref:DUF1684 domain-containing protein n=1 Tax=Quatrionicoccus australiensis TaxID=138118 RepID=UPI001CF9F470|nr:DUF1684 domain-containing protein [Quatrionicoccus australiensis]MCB4358170.1 DUF1684 domain-containing protein [Quatrionicoccus australiensis]
MSQELKDWQAQRHAELSGPDSWLGMQGLFWLEPGENRVGSSENCRVQLPSGPAHLGDLIWAGELLSWQPLAGSARELQTDRSGQPSAVDHENLSFFIVDREGRLAARVRDRDWAARQPFAGLSYFPAAAEWAIEAEWQVLAPPLSMEVPNVTGELKTVLVSHKAVFNVAGQYVELLPMSVGEHEVFFVFRDRTSGKETYGAGRFLKVLPAVDGKIRLDFNHAYNPPCAFTPFATCPLPPPENWLPFAVPAGEMKPGA